MSGVAADGADAGGGHVEQLVALDRLARRLRLDLAALAQERSARRRTIDWASTWKKRRAAPRVSAKPKPSVPSEV